MILMGLTPVRDVAFARSHSPFGQAALPAQAIPLVKDAAKDGVSAAEAFIDESDSQVDVEHDAAEYLPKPSPIFSEPNSESDLSDDTAPVDLPSEEPAEQPSTTLPLNN
jgi:hypothetical protein